MNPFKQFIDLVSIDQVLISLFQERRRIAENLADLYDKKNDLLDEQDVLEQQLHDAKKEVDRLELDMNSYAQQEKVLRDRFHGITNNKEFQSLKKEADHCKEQQYQLEQQLITAWNILESAQKKIDTLKRNQVESITRLEEQEKQLEQQEQQVASHIQQQEQKRQEQATQVPQEWMVLYDRMKHSVSNPVVLLDVQGACSGCFSPLGQQDLMSLTQRKKLLSCPSCFRLLYTTSMQEDGCES